MPAAAEVVPMVFHRAMPMLVMAVVVVAKLRVRVVSLLNRAQQTLVAAVEVQKEMEQALAGPAGPAW
jgi:hypothetical protein